MVLRRLRSFALNRLPASVSDPAVEHYPRFRPLAATYSSEPFARTADDATATNEDEQARAADTAEIPEPGAAEHHDDADSHDEAAAQPSLHASDDNAHDAHDASGDPQDEFSDDYLFELLDAIKQRDKQTGQLELRAADHAASPETHEAIDGGTAADALSQLEDADTSDGSADGSDEDGWS